MENLLDLMFREEEGLYVPHNFLTNIASIRTIIERDPGRKHPETQKLERRRARMELSYIYMMVRRDLYSGFTADQKAKTVRERIGLPDTWMPDDMVQLAIRELTEDTKTKQDKLLESAQALADDLIDAMLSMRENTRRVTEFLSRDIKNLTGVDKELRTTEVKAMKEELLKLVDMHKSVETVVRSLDVLTAERAAQEKLENKKKLSSLELKKDRYERRADEE